MGGVQTVVVTERKLASEKQSDKIREIFGWE
jgi:hypothetical protein